MILAPAPIAGRPGATMSHDHGETPRRSGPTQTGRWVFLAFVAIAAYLLIAEHRAHLSGLLYYLPFLVLLLCPLLHVFMHGLHRHHGGDHKQSGHTADKEGR
jgi:hypothetical protein